jgi:hypothetical protein
MHKILLVGSLLFTAFIAPASAADEFRDVAPFTRMAFDVPARIVLRQADAQSVELKGNPEALAEIETVVRDGALTVANKRKVRWGRFSSPAAAPIDILVSVKRIEGVTVASAGVLTAPAPLHVEDARFLVSGAGALRAEVEATGTLQTEISGAGKMDLTGRVKRLDSRINGSGTLTLACAVHDDASFAISGSGTVTATGSADYLKASISGSGTIRAEGFVVDKSAARISGVGLIALDVKSALDASISGNGEVLYKSRPAQLTSHSSGRGKVGAL